MSRSSPITCVASTTGRPSGAFFLSYNGFPPFQVSDESGRQFELRRSVPGTVRYTSGWQVTVEQPQEIGPAAGLTRVWLVPITVVNRESSNAVLGVGVCQPAFDGRTIDPYFESAALRALGDVDRPTPLPPGGSATFELTPFLSRRP